MSFRRAASRIFPATVLGLTLVSCSGSSSDSIVLTADTEWRFDTPQEDWKPVVPWNPMIDPVEVTQLDDALRVTLTESMRNLNGNPIGGLVLEVADWDYEDLAYLVVRARTTDGVGHLSIGLNRREGSGTDTDFPWPFEYSSEALPDVVSDGTVRTYRVRLDCFAGHPPPEEPIRQIALWFGASDPASIDILSITLTTKVANFQAWQHGRFDFPVTIGGQEHILTYDGTHDVMRDADARVKLVVFVHHGGSQNPNSYFDGVMDALDVADRDRPELNLKATTLVVSPAMIGECHMADNPERYARGHYPFWDGRWMEGANSLNDPPVSNYDLLDGVVRQIADFYPGVKAVVHVGHSSGGQLLNRYSFGTPVYDELQARGIFVRYIVANPGSVLYFDRQRPDLSAEEGFVDYRGRVPLVAGSECVNFNRYRRGLAELAERAPYMTRRPVAAMLAGFRERELVLFQGLADTLPRGLASQSCEGLQGRYRLEMGKRYYEYLGHFFGPDIYETKSIVFAPGVGHNSREMFLSEPGRAIIFIDADSAAASAASRAGRRP